MVWTHKSQEIGIKFTITDCSNFDKRCSGARIVSSLFYYYCTIVKICWIRQKSKNVCLFTANHVWLFIHLNFGQGYAEIRSYVSKVQTFCQKTNVCLGLYSEQKWYEKWHSFWHLWARADDKCKIVCSPFLTYKMQ